MTQKERTRISRREFLKYSAMAGAAAALPWQRAFGAAVKPGAGVGPYGIGSPNLTKFVDPIRNIGTDIPLASPDQNWVGQWPATHYTIDIGEYRDVLHSDFVTVGKPAYMGAGYNGSLLRGFGQGGVHKHLGGVIVAGRNQPVQITFNNNLPPGNAPVPNDITLPQPAGNRFDRTAIHIHGGHVPWISDGGPFDWWAPDGTSGDSFLNNTVLNSVAALNQGEYYYPNDQPGRLLWYHDHAWGITRTNAYSGIASAYVITDPIGEAAFDTANPGVPSALNLGAINSTFFYLVFQDKIFIPPTGAPANYMACANAGPGDLFYAYVYDTALFGPQGIPTFGGTAKALQIPSCVPEFFGDTMLVNGAAYPTLTVEARPVRIRMLNACNARFLNLRLVSPAGTTFPSNCEPSPNAWGPRMVQIGTEGGYLPQPVVVAAQGALPLLMAPAERADVVIDFSKAKAGTEFILYNDAPGPFPGGYSGFDYYPGNPKTPASIPGYGPNTRTLMKFKIVAATGTVTALPKTLNTTIAGLNDPPLVTQVPGVPNPIPTSVTVGGVTYPVAATRLLTLNEGFDEYGRLQQMEGTALQVAGAAPGFFGARYLDPTTENVAAGSVEVWQIANLTADTHPIHFHLVNVQILYRQPIKTKGFTTAFALNPNGQPYAPDPNELGWKETVRMNPGEVITVIAKWDLNSNLPFSVPNSPRTGGNEYVFHCHILEHEEHDMMRPINVA